MYRSDIVTILQPRADKAVGVLYAVNEVAAPLYHALVDELSERLILAHESQIIQKLIPETAVYQMAGGMLGAADIKIDAAPVFIGLASHESRVIVGIHIPQVVGRRSGKSGHRAQLKRITLGGGPVEGASQRRLAALGGEELVDLGQFERQTLVGQHVGHTVFVVHRERLAPVALTREYGVAQTVVYLHLAYALARYIVLGGLYGILHLHAVEIEIGSGRIDHAAALGVETLLADVGTLDQRHYRQIEMTRESIVAAVVGRHSHDGAGAVAGKHIVAHPHRDAFARKGIDRISTRKHAAHLLVDHTLTLGLVADAVDIAVDSLLLLGSGHHGHIVALRRQHHKRNPEHRVGSRCEYLKRQTVVASVDGKLHLRTLRTAYPVALCFLQRVGPVELVESVKQTLRVGRHPQTPLIHQFLLHGIAAAYRHTLAHLVIGQDSAELRTPVDHRISKISYAVVHQRLRTLLLVHGVPFIGRESQFLAACGPHALRAMLGKMLFKPRHGHRLVESRVVVGVKHAYERPLRPLVVVGRAGTHLAVPVIAETYLVELTAIALDIVDCGHFRMLTGLYGILLRGQTIGVVAHRMQHIEALQTLVARIYVGSYIAERMTHVQSRSRRIRKHVEHIKLLARAVLSCAVSALFFPVGLPPLLYFLMIIFHCRINV